MDVSGGVLPGVMVLVAGSGQTTQTSADGTFCLASLPDGDHELQVSLDGFAPKRLRASAPRATPLTVTLDAAIRTDVVVTATRTSRSLGDVPVRTEVISRDQLDRSGARTLADAVEYTTGVRVGNNCQTCNFSQIRLLGLDGPYTQILMDGQPIVSSLAQVYGIEQIPARMIERIEVVKGGGSALYGPGSVGGVVKHHPARAAAVRRARRGALRYVRHRREPLPERQRRLGGPGSAHVRHGVRAARSDPAVRRGRRRLHRSEPPRAAGRRPAAEPVPAGGPGEDHRRLHARVAGPSRRRLAAPAARRGAHRRGDRRRAFVSWLHRQRVEWPQVHLRQGYAADVPTLFGIEQLPSTVVVDRGGRLAGIEVRGDQLVALVDALVGACPETVDDGGDTQ